VSTCNASAHPFRSALALCDLERLYREVRHTSEKLGEPLSDADATVQSMPDTLAICRSPAREGHVTLVWPRNHKEHEMTTDKIVQHMEVIGAGGVHVGTVDGVANGRIRLAKRDSGEGRHKGHAHFIDLGLVADVEGQRVRLSANAAVAVTFEEEQLGKPV
jgi:hypothetical protein